MLYCNVKPIRMECSHIVELSIIKGNIDYTHHSQIPIDNKCTCRTALSSCSHFFKQNILDCFQVTLISHAQPHWVPSDLVATYWRGASCWHSFIKCAQQ